jgi:hypothetical protein
MKQNYLASFDISNGYRCGCCYQSWKLTRIIQLDTDNAEEFFEKKSNHTLVFYKLVGPIYNAGCDVIKQIVRSNDEFEGSFSLTHEFYSETLESRVTFEFDDDLFEEYNLQEHWKTFEQMCRNDKKAEEKKREINNLERRLEILKSQNN